MFSVFNAIYKRATLPSVRGLSECVDESIYSLLRVQVKVAVNTMSHFGPLLSLWIREWAINKGP